MKSNNKNLANEISAAILSKLHGLNAKSAKKLVKAVDECSKDIAKKFAKLQKDEEQGQEKDAMKATKKLVAKAKKASKAKEKSAEKAAMSAKIAIVTNEKTPSSKPVTAPKAMPATHAKKPVAKAKPVVTKVEPTNEAQ